MSKVRLGDVCTIQSGGTPSRSKKEYWNGSFPWVKISDFNSKYLYSTDEFISEEGLNNSSAKIFPENSILFTIFATLGEVTILKIPAATNQAIAGLTIKDDSELDIDYLYYFLLSLKTYVDSIGRGVAQNNINMSILKSIKIPMPSIETQRKNAYKLDEVSRLIDLCNNTLKKFDTLVKSRFVEMFGEPRSNPNSYRIAPFETIVEYMGDIGSNGANKVVVEHLDMKDEEDYALMVRFLNFTKNDFTNDVKYISKESYEFFKKSKLYGGELIICKIGSAGLNYVMPNLNRPVSLGLNQIMVRINNTVLMPFLYQYLHTEYGEYLISGCINGAVTKSITKTELKKIPVLLPPLSSQQRFADFVAQVEKQKATVQQSIDKLEILKKSLMQEYFG